LNATNALNLTKSLDKEDAMKIIYAVLLIALLIFMPFLVFEAAAATVVLSPVKDNTLYEDNTGSISNAAGQHFFAGQNVGSLVRRGLIAFDIAGNIPAGSRIVNATLTLHMSRTISGSANVSLHKLLANWGEGTSDAPGNEGGGASATDGDATWLHKFLDTADPVCIVADPDCWSSPGGDFEGTASASGAVGGIGFYTWGPTDQLVADVQAWLNAPATNFGWLLRGNEAASGTTKRFDTKENLTEANRPELTVEFNAPLDDPIPGPIPLGDIPVKLETVAAGLTAPNWGTFAPGDSGRLFVTDQDGILWAIDLASGDKSVFADVSGLLVELGAFGPGTFDERGLLGVAFHPDYTNNGLLYTYTSQPVDGPADFSTIPPGATANHQSVITEWQVPAPGNPASVVDPSSRRELLRIDEPQFNHNAGALNFGPDGMLYISLGDGGGRDDQGVGHGTSGNGQDPSTVLGSFLRIDPRGNNSANGRYGIPADNPFVGLPGFAEEIYAYGFRNPFRFSFDMDNGDLYVGDVGQGDIEEVDVVVAGGNYGWRVKEGSFCFEPNGDDRGFVFDQDPCPNEPAGLIDPVAQYDHDEGIAIIGGFVYRGTEIPELAGKYVFGDLSQQFSGNNGRLFYLEGSEVREFPIVDSAQEDLGLSLLGLGQDANGEIYVLANSTGIPFESTGVVLKIVSVAPCEGDFDGDGDVDGTDLAMFAADFGRTDCNTGPPCSGDFNGDGDVDGTDLAIFAADFGRTDCP
jgi:glucose/arabinose dehydrogenase